MGVASSYDANGEPVDRYRWPARMLVAEGAHAALRDWRKQAIADREEMLSAQALAGRSGDREGARYFKEAAAHLLKMQRAMTLMLPWFGEPDTKQEAVSPELWPIEMASELDVVSARLLIEFG
jgi:hypothetical protein